MRARWQAAMDSAIRITAHIALLKDAAALDRALVGNFFIEQAGMRASTIGPSAEVDTLLEKGLATMENWVQGAPTERAPRAWLAFAYGSTVGILAAGEHSPQRLARALDAGNKALALYTALGSEFPSEPSYPDGIAGVRMGLARSLADLGRFAEAASAIDLALQRWRARTDADPQNAALVGNLVVMLGTAARIANLRGNSSKAIELGREGLRYFASAPADMQKNFAFREARSEIQLFMGLALVRAGADPAAARTRRLGNFEEACALLQSRAAFVDELLRVKPGTLAHNEVDEARNALAACKVQLGRLSAR